VTISEARLGRLPDGELVALDMVLFGRSRVALDTVDIAALVVLHTCPSQQVIFCPKVSYFDILLCLHALFDVVTLE